MSKTKKKQPITYTYYSQKGERFTITVGKNGVTEADITTLTQMDRKEKLNDRYEYENRDYKTENKKLKYTKEPTECVGDPIEELAARIPDIVELLEPEEEQANPMLEQLEGYIDLLTPQQKELIYELYGSNKSLTEIAKEHGVSAQAIYNRKGKIIARLKKLFNEKDAGSKEGV